jgi:P27 family predicted phage terminase small subunit
MRKKPTRLKELEGTLRRDRTNRREPRPPKAGTVAPRHGLPLGVRREFKFLLEQLAPMNVVTVSDIAALEITAAAADEYWRNHRFLTRKGASYETVNAAGSRMARNRPEVAAAADAWRRYRAGLLDFGMTPSSRPKVEADDPPIPDSSTFKQARAAADLARSPGRFFRSDA